MTLLIRRLSDKIFKVTSLEPYWGNGECISERVAFTPSGRLSNSRAQAIDRDAGNRYILVSCFGLRNPFVLESVRQLEIGEDVILVGNDLI